MGVFQNNLMGAAAAAASAGGGSFYDHTIDNSIKVSNSSANSTATKYLYRDGDAGNRDTWTLGMWIKRARISTSNSHTSMSTWGGHSGSGSGRGYGMVNDYTGTINGMSFEDNNGSSWHVTTRTNAMYRDLSAWTHVCWRYDSTQGTDSNRARMYVNGELITNLQSTTYPAQNADHSWNSGGYQFIGTNLTASNGNNPYQGFDGYIAEVVSIDGTSLDPMDNLVETKNGVIVPKDPSGLTFGTNGFYLKFESSSDLGNDSSGNNNDFTVVGISSFDQTTDTPTNNFCTINPLYRGDQTTDAKYGVISKGNLQHEFSGSTDGQCPCTHKTPASGKWYFEYVITGGGGSSSYSPAAGIIDPDTYTMNGGNYNDTGSIQYLNNTNTVRKSGSETGAYSGSRGSNNDVMGIAVDMDNGAFYVSKNGTFQTIDGGSQGDPTSGASRTGAGATWTPASEFLSGMVPLSAPTGGSQPIIIMNFGQEGTFANIKTAGNNSDANGHGNFFSAVPSGYLAICTANLSVVDEVDPAQTDDNYPQKLFGMLQYTGNGSERTIDTSFQIDSSWARSTVQGQSWYAFDTTRGFFGASSNNLYMKLDTDDAEATAPQYNFKSQSGSDFTLTGGTWFNSGTHTQQMWNWRLNGGTTSTNSTGSVSVTQQVDPSGHFSISTYSGAGGTGTIGHGLSAVPTFVVVKQRNGSNSWATYAKGAGNELYGNLATNTAFQDAVVWQDTTPSSSLVYLGDNNEVNHSGRTYLAYCWADCEGYIKSGKYVGNGDVDGTFIYLGFKPALFAIKHVSSGDDPLVWDSLNGPINPISKTMSMHDSSAIVDNSNRHVDFLSNGVKIRTSNSNANSTNSDGIVYLAMAHNPFKYATAK